MSDDLIAKLTALAEKATPPPWNCRHRAAVTEVVSSTRLIMVDSRYNPRVVKPSDQEFIAALVTAWPAIRNRLAAADQLRGAADGFARTSAQDEYEPLVDAIEAYDTAKKEGTT